MYTYDGSKTFRRNAILYLTDYTTLRRTIHHLQSPAWEPQVLQSNIFTSAMLVLVFLRGPEGGLEQLRLERWHCLLCHILKNEPHKQLCVAELSGSPATRCTLYSTSYRCASKKMKYVREHNQKAKWNVLRSLWEICSGWKICELPKQSCAYWAFLLLTSNHLTDFHEPLHEAGSPYFTPPPPCNSPPSGPGPHRYRGFTITLRHATLGRLLWTSDQPDAETSTLQHTKDRHPCPRRDSNPQPQQASRRRPAP